MVLKLKPKRSSWSIDVHLSQICWSYHHFKLISFADLPDFKFYWLTVWIPKQSKTTRVSRHLKNQSVYYCIFIVVCSCWILPVLACGQAVHAQWFEWPYTATVCVRSWVDHNNHVRDRGALEVDLAVLNCWLSQCFRQIFLQVYWQIPFLYQEIAEWYYYFSLYFDCNSLVTNSISVPKIAEWNHYVSLYFHCLVLWQIPFLFQEIPRWNPLC
jgi:hypothetical protein